jgi:prolyl oligopeptidase
MQTLEGGRYRLFTIQWGWARNDVLLQDVGTGEVRPVAASLQAHVQARYHDGRLWILTDYRAPRYRLLVTDLDRPDPSHWREVIPEGADVLDDFTFLGDSIYATYLHDVSARIRVFRMDGTPDGELQLPPFSSASIRPAAPGKALLSIRSFKIPPETWLVDLATGERSLYEPSRVPFDSTGVVVEQEWYRSKDGTRVPMFIVHRAGVGRPGGAPTMLTGYGGFNLPLLPGFSAEGALWLERGGIYAVANLRGGMEFGERWHRDGMLQNKQHVFDDFIGAAQHLIDRGYTTPARLAIHGESNGGLLMGAALTQRPDLFRAVLCGFPDLDLVRFYTFTKTNNEPALLEYGNAAVALQFPAILAFSPYQNVVDGTRYPAVFLFNGGHDTRVSPLQARKMAAKLQAATTSGRPVIFRYRPKEGHAAGRGRPFDVLIADQAMEQAFVWQEIGS